MNFYATDVALTLAYGSSGQLNTGGILSVARWRKRRRRAGSAEHVAPVGDITKQVAFYLFEIHKNRLDVL
jgi:uncharacterized membrane protein